MNSDPSIAVDEVTDMASLLEFIGILASDFQQAELKDIKIPSNPSESMHGWENIKVGSYLDAAKAWAEDNNILCKIENPYTCFARILHSGKYYE